LPSLHSGMTHVNVDLVRSVVEEYRKSAEPPEIKIYVIKPGEERELEEFDVRKWREEGIPLFYPANVISYMSAYRYLSKIK